MADVYAIFGTLLALGIAFPGMLTAWWLLFPVGVERARQRLTRTPWSCLGLGVLAALAVAIPAALLNALPLGAAKFLGTVLAFASFGVASIGAAGLASEMGDRVTRQAGGKFTPAGGFVRGALALELAAAFPIIGWFLVIPLATVACFGASAFALLRWSPKPLRAAAPEPALSRA
jgi:hypothetical protein